MSSDNALQEKSRKDGKIVLMAFVGFFVTFAAVDAYFVYKALSTHTGVVVENAYEQGLKFNDLLAKAKKQDSENTASQERSTSQ